MKLVLLASASIVALASWSAPAAAQNATAPQTQSEASPPDESESEIIVTAEKRGERIQDIPIAIYAATGDRLRDSGVGSVQDLPQLAPSLQFARSTSSFYASIRGVGSETTDVGGDPAIALSQDGVPLVRIAMLNADFLDVQRVEVLRGPQGTIAGRNATGGAINIYSNLPTATNEAEARFTIGSYGFFGAEGFVSGPVAGDWLRGRIAFGTAHADGWFHNTVVDPPSPNRKQDLNTQDRYHVRASLEALLGEKLTALVIVDRSDDHSTPQPGNLIGNARGDGSPDELDIYNATFGTAIPHPDMEELRSQSNIVQSKDVEQTLASFRLTYAPSPNATITATTGYVRRDDTAYADSDGTAAQIAENTPVVQNSEVFSQELTLSAKPASWLDLIAGGIYFHDWSEEPVLYRNRLFGLLSPGIEYRGLAQRTNSAAIYGQARLFFAPGAHLDVGARYTHDSKTIVFGPYLINGALVSPQFEDSESWGAFTPRAALHYEVSRALALYGSVSKGYKAGGYNALSAPQKYDPETVVSYDMGVKYSWRGLRAGLSGFYSDYSDIQQNVYGLVGGIPSASVTNASKADIKGVEVELDARITGGFRIFGNLSYLYAKIVSGSTLDPSFPERGVQSLSGRRLPRSPRWQGSLGAEISEPVSDRLTLDANVNVRWQSKMFFDIYNNDTVAQNSFAVVNGRIGLSQEGGKWQLSAFVTNAFDKRYYVNKLVGVLITPGVFAQIAAPRQIGLTVGYQFR